MVHSVQITDVITDGVKKYEFSTNLIKNRLQKAVNNNLLVKTINYKILWQFKLYLIFLYVFVITFSLKKEVYFRMRVFDQ